MLSGRELLTHIDNDLLEYSNSLEGPEAELNDWRALCTLHERVSLLRLYTVRMKSRHSRLETEFDSAEAILAALEKKIEQAAKKNRPPDTTFQRAFGRGGDDRVMSREAPKEIGMFWADVLKHIAAEAGVVTINAGDERLNPVLLGFHAAEIDSRWSGPRTSSVILVPVQALRAAGINILRLMIDAKPSEELKVLFGLSLSFLPSCVSHEESQVIIDLDGIDEDFDRIILVCDRTRLIGNDPRYLGLRLREISLEQSYG